MVAAEDREHLCVPGMPQAWAMVVGTRIVAVELGLAGAVRVHLEEGLTTDLTAIVCIPTSVYHAPIVQYLGTSASATIRAARGISSPFNPNG